jgi:anti-anti-sigma factor
MNIEIKERNGSYIGILSGWIDTAEASKFLEDLKPLMGNAEKSIELDCAKLEYICSLGLRGLLQLKKESAAKGGSMILTHVEGEVQKILKLTGFDRLFDIRN